MPPAKSLRISVIAVFCGIFVPPFYCSAQQIESLKDAPPVKVTGGIGVTNMLTSSTDPNNQRDPFFWQLQGNINFSFFGVIDAPFSASLNNQKPTTSQPAIPSQVGISPGYKIYTTHLGWRSMNFSKYTLGGQIFLGAGAEIKPKEFWLSGSAMYGRLQKQIQPIRGEDPGVYQRTGYGVKLTAGKSDQLSLSIFRAKDDEESILLDSLAGDVTPKENLTWSLSGKKKIGQNLQLQVEYAQSGLTQDTRNEERTLNNFNYYNNVGKVFTPNATTQFFHAFESNVSYSLQSINLLFGYTRIDPDYQTLGTQSVNNDLEEYKGGVNWQMFKGKVSIGTNLGVQRNNLDNSMEKGVRKLAGAGNISWAVTDHLNFSCSYTNFNTQSLRRRTPALQPLDILQDTLEFFQVTENVSFSSTYNTGSETLKHGLNLTNNYQVSQDSENNGNNALNSNLMYSLLFVPIKLNLSSSYNYSLTNSNGIDFIAHGPTTSVAKPIAKDAVKLSLAFTRLSSELNGTLQNIITNWNLSVRYTYAKKHNFSLAGIRSQRQSQIEGAPSAIENRLNFQYNMTF